MFISLFKLALIALVIMLVWSFLKPKTDPRQAPRSAGRGGAKGVEDLAKCSVCGTYVPATGAKPCGRGNCPNV